MTKNVLNTIHCGDFLALHEMLGDREFDVIIADPSCDIGEDIGHDGEDHELHAFVKWSLEWIAACFKHLSGQGVLYIYGFPEILAHVAVNFNPDQQRWLVWHYTNAIVPEHNFWQQSHESILSMWKKKRPNLHIDLIR